MAGRAAQHTTALRIDATETISFNFMGRTREGSSTVSYWYAPSVRWWVKRLREVEGQLLIDEAAFIE